MSQTTTKLMTEYKDANEWANLDLSAWPRATLPGAQMRQNEAKQELPKLRKAYYDILQGGAAFTIFPFVEEGQDPAVLAQFMEVAAEVVNPLTVSAEALYRTFAEQIEPTLGAQRLFGTTQFLRLLALLTDLGRELNFRDIFVPGKFDILTVATLDDLTAVVRSLVRGMVEDRLNRVVIEDQIVREAMRIRYTRSVVPVIVTDAIPEERQSLGATLFSGTTFEVPLNAENVTKEGVLKTLNGIKKTLKK